MSAKKILWVMLAITLLCFVLLLRRFMAADEEPAPVAAADVLPVQQAAQPATRWVLAFARDKAAGASLSLNDVKWLSVPEDDLNSQIKVIDREGAKLDEYRGAVLRSAALTDALVNPFDLLKPGDPGFLSVQLRPGQRAYTFKVPKSSAQSGLVAPGDYIDVVGVLERIEKTAGGQRMLQLERSFIAASRVRVLAVDTHVVSDYSTGEDALEGKEINMTVELSPKQATAVALADAQGHLVVALRHPGDERKTYGSTRTVDFFPETRAGHPDSPAVMFRGSADKAEEE